ncbi:hypothetical protein M976_02869 [Buttiauxella ferragutiae ATCC 51602]|uniref:Bacteriophage protein n=1 Tax=Buttiauxella ferragutiae ATCC 51602 TaxID=1354252 RepID=A0ABX2W6Z1_9ENTR|nr:hypothetical protein [Buttiauxella ferragutiae]OAT26708.1 hypothetical protein M976_02869 [Buttiauxella ferragutiae ATCC 51602]
MTPKERRAHHAAIERAAAAPRKSYLGRFTPLNGIQSGWIKSLLNVWGEYAGGKTNAQYRLENCNRFVSKAKDDKWSDSQLSRITAALEQARHEGYKGHEAVRRAHTVLWAVSLSEMIDEVSRQDDADLIEKAVLNAFKPDDPVYCIGLNYYTTRKKISDLSRELQQVAPWLNENEARKRTRWCIQIFQAKVFLSVRKMNQIV